MHGALPSNRKRNVKNTGAAPTHLKVTSAFQRPWLSRPRVLYIPFSVRPHGHNFAFSLLGSYQYSNPRRLRSPREPRRTKCAHSRARLKKECSRNLRPEVTTVSAKMANLP